MALHFTARLIQSVVLNCTTLKYGVILNGLRRIAEAWHLNKVETLRITNIINEFKFLVQKQMPVSMIWRLLISIEPKAINKILHDFMTMVQVSDLFITFFNRILLTYSRQNYST